MYSVVACCQSRRRYCGQHHRYSQTYQPAIKEYGVIVDWIIQAAPLCKWPPQRFQDAFWSGNFHLITVRGKRQCEKGGSFETEKECNGLNGADTDKELYSHTHDSRNDG